MSSSPHGRHPERDDGATLVVSGAQVMDRDGTFSPATVTVVGGTIVAVERGGVEVERPRPGGRDGLVVDHVDATGRWLMPGVVDCHTHLGWTTFLPADEDQDEDADDDRHEDAGSGSGSGSGSAAGAGAATASAAPAMTRTTTTRTATTGVTTTTRTATTRVPTTRAPSTRVPTAGARLARVAPGLAATLRAGVTSVRDAGGAASTIRDALATGRLVGPQMQTAVATITDELSRDPAALRERVRALVADGADWIKVVATGGVMTPDGSDDESPFDARDLRAVVDEAAGLGVRVMVHAWGGDALTHSIAAGVASVEHGMFLTERQAAAGAERGVVLVPTLAIYSEVAEMARRGELPERVRARAARVVEAHPRAVQRAVAAGMAVALGSDFGTTDQHGRNLIEIDHLASAGLGAAGALVAATRVGAGLLGLGTGVLEPGQRLDAVLLRGDPTTTSLLRDPQIVETVFVGGSAVG